MAIRADENPRCADVLLVDAAVDVAAIAGRNSSFIAAVTMLALCQSAEHHRCQECMCLRTHARTRTDEIAPCWNFFVHLAVNALSLDAMSEVRGEVENALHQGSSQYMDAIYSKFVKNFDKFDLYVRRNIVAVPADVADAVAAWYAASGDAPATSHAKDNNDTLEMHVTSPVSIDQQKEMELEYELGDLRYQLVMVSEKKQALKMEHNALKKKSDQLADIDEQLKSLHQIPQQSLSPFGCTLDQLRTLRSSIKRIDTIQAVLDNDARERKRIKFETRETFARKKLASLLFRAWSINHFTFESSLLDYRMEIVESNVSCDFPNYVLDLKSAKVCLKK
ncbi:hypothetical protein FI667_g7196, partial [Globisporangium splendens]